jgi:hypothetical protein
MNSPMLQITDLVETLAKSSRLLSKVDEILQDAREDGMSGEELERTLVMSGLALGVEETHTHFGNNVKSMIGFLRKSVDSLNKVIPHVSSIEALKELNDMHALFKKVLVARSQELTSMAAQTYGERYGISQKVMTGERDLDDLQLSEVGFNAMSNSKPYYFAWAFATREDALGGMKCRCELCLVGHYREKKFDPSKEFSRIMRDHGSMSNAFTGFGKFIVQEVRNTLTDILEDAPKHEEENPMDAEEMMKSLFRNMKGRGD